MSIMTAQTESPLTAIFTVDDNPGVSPGQLARIGCPFTLASKERIND
jgi:hypothetical protein